jgi:CheY-like chemotaxis protein
LFCRVLPHSLAKIGEDEHEPAHSRGDEPDVEVLFRQRFRRDLPAGRFTMEFAQSGPDALQRISGATDVSLILILSDINMPGMSGFLNSCPELGLYDLTFPSS